MIASKCWLESGGMRVEGGVLLSIVFCCSVIVVLLMYCTAVSWVNLTLDEGTWLS